VFSLFINGDPAVALQAIQTYRERFDASHGTEPQVILAVSVIVAESEAEAAELAGHQKVVKVRLASGKLVTLGTREQAEEFGRQAGEPYTIEEQEPWIVKGTKATVREQLLALQKDTGIEEVIVTSNITPFEKRIRSFELLREALVEAAVEA